MKSLDALSLAFWLAFTMMLLFLFLHPQETRHAMDQLFWWFQ